MHICYMLLTDLLEDKVLTLLNHLTTSIIPPVYEVYRGYIVFAFSVCLFVCVCVCVCKLFFPSKISQELLALGS